MKSRSDYSHFILHDLVRHIQSDHVLIVQWDGFVIAPQHWSDDFLKYDYIGAPWPQLPDEWNVGNGGFSLRSRRLLEACSTLGVVNEEAEDVLICRTNRARLEHGLGLRFADADVAARFSFERTRAQGTEFGFHGVFNMPDVVGLADFAVLYGVIDKALINAKDHKAIVRRALRHLGSRHAWSILRSYVVHRFAGKGGLVSRIGNVIRQ